MTTLGPPDATLLEYTDASLARTLPPSLMRARSDILAASVDLLATPEAALALPWEWIGGSEYEIRYGAYRAFEALELAEVEARRAAAPPEATETHAARIIAPATAARWDLRGILAPLSDDILDAEPGGEEWTVRQALGHIISGQRGYAWGTAWWQANPHDVVDPGLPAMVPEEIWTALPDDPEEESGGLEEIRERLDAILDLSAERLAGIPDERLAFGARWSGFAVTVGFRLGRWSSHIREHTLQIEKTLAMLRYEPTEPERLARLLLAAYGRTEAAVFGRRPAETAVRIAIERVAAGAVEARDAIRAAREAAARG